jgi:hypothetical protein
MKQLRAYQQIAVDRGINTNLLCSDQMGLGKSLTAIEICKAVFSKCDAPALVVMPKGIKLQWEQMILDQDPTANILTIQSDFDTFEMSQLVLKARDLDYILVHYEALIKFNAQLAKIKYSTIVVDECHRIKNRKAQRTIAVKTLKAFRKIGLSGTPYDKNPADLWSILNWLQPKQFTSYWKFIDEFIDIESVWIGARQVPKSFKIRDPKAFVEMLKPHMIRRTKKSVLPQLPPLQKTFVPIELTPAQRKSYQAIKNVKDMEVNFPELDEPMWIEYAMTKLVRLLQCASDPAGLGLNAASAKLEWLQEWISDHPSEPILVLSRYRKSAERVFQTIGGDALVMAGSELTKPLTASRRIVGTIASLKEGHDLGHISTMILLDLDYSSITMDQMFERHDRGGNTEPKQVLILEATNTADELVRQCLGQKWDTRQLIDQFMESENAHGAISNSV